MNLIALTCPSCNSKLDIKEDISQFSCAACGNEFIVEREGGIVSLRPLVETAKQISQNTDRTASELAIGRLGKELSSLKYELSKEREPGTFHVAMLLFTGLSILLIFIGGDTGMGIAGTLIFGGLSYGIHWLKKPEIERLEKEIAGKQKEYKYHKKIVSAN